MHLQATDSCHVETVPPLTFLVAMCAEPQAAQAVQCRASLDGSSRYCPGNHQRLQRPASLRGAAATVHSPKAYHVIIDYNNVCATPGPNLFDARALLVTTIILNLNPISLQCQDLDAWPLQMQIINDMRMLSHFNLYTLLTTIRSTSGRIQ